MMRLFRDRLLTRLSAGWEIEVPASGVVLFDVRTGHSASPVPLHWRVSDATKPPLDIAINPADAGIQSVQIVLVDEWVDYGSYSCPDSHVDGLPTVVIRDWPEDRYRDVAGRVSLIRSRRDELVAEVTGEPPVVYTGARDSLRFGWDDAGALCQLIIGPLSSAEWGKINSFRPVR